MQNGRSKETPRVGRQGVTAIFWFEHTHAHTEPISSILEWPLRNVKRKHKEKQSHDCTPQNQVIWGSEFECTQIIVSQYTFQLQHRVLAKVEAC